MIGFIAHVDTSPAVSGANVTPVVHQNYRGGDLVLPGDPTQLIRVDEHPVLRDLIGDDIITTDGTTLLGSDDKSGVAAIMTLVDTLLINPQLPHGTIRVAFTADEEVGRGADAFDVAAFGAAFAYTVDGEVLGEISHETWGAWLMSVTFHGRSAHPGSAKGVMVNAAYAFADFVAALPADMRPEATEGRCRVHSSVRGIDRRRAIAREGALLRDFETSGLEAKERLVRRLADEAVARTPGVRVEIELREQVPEHERGALAAPRCSPRTPSRRLVVRASTLR